MTTATEKKITKATVKSFIRKNRASLLINVESSFDGMVDGVRDTGSRDFSPICHRDYYDRELCKFVEVSHDCENSMGIRGVWFVHGPRNSCRRFETETLVGFEVYNCCGTWKVAVAK
jgi:hypothetical protein